MQTDGLHRFDPRAWELITWSAVIALAVYGVIRNYPYERIESSPFETRVMTDRLADELGFVTAAEGWPAGWPIYCIRPNAEITWDMLFYPPPIGAAGIFNPRGPRMKFVPVAFWVNCALIFANLLAVIYVTRTRVMRFSLRTLLFLTGLASVCFLLWNIEALPNLWDGLDSYIATVYLAPIFLAIITWCLGLLGEPRRVVDTGVTAKADRT